jgi:hypothetical protein
MRLHGTGFIQMSNVNRNITLEAKLDMHRGMIMRLVCLENHTNQNLLHPVFARD